MSLLDQCMCVCFTLTNVDVSWYVSSKNEKWYQHYIIKLLKLHILITMMCIRIMYTQFPLISHNTAILQSDNKTWYNYVWMIFTLNQTIIYVHLVCNILISKMRSGANQSGGATLFLSREIKHSPSVCLSYNIIWHRHGLKGKVYCFIRHVHISASYFF